MLKNKIKEQLEKKEISVNQLSRDIKMNYRNAHALVNREYLDDTKMINVYLVSQVLKININDLFEYVDED